MSHSKLKSRSILSNHNQQTNTYKKMNKPSVHIFPNKQYPQIINQLKSKLDSLHIISAVYKNYTYFQSIIQNVGQYTSKQICLIQLQNEVQGCDCCFPKNYVFPKDMNIYIVFFSFKPLRSNRPHLLSLNEIISFCEKQLKPYKIKLKSIQNLRNDSKSKNTSTHSTQKQKLSIPSHSLISQFNSKQYQLLFYLTSDQQRVNLNQNQFNYQILIRSLQKLQKCQPFASFQELLKKQIHKKQKKYIILFNLSSQFLSILNRIKRQWLTCFEIILYGDMKPIHLYLEKNILLATRNSNLIFKFLKNHGFDSPLLRQQHVKNQRRFSISSNDFRNQMDNLMNSTSQYSRNSTFQRSSGLQMEVKKKIKRHWLVDKDGSQSHVFITILVKVEQLQSNDSIFNKIKSLQKSRLSSNKKITKSSYISPKKKQSSLKKKQAQQELQTNELQLYSNIAGGHSQINKKKSQINQENTQQEVPLKQQKQFDLKLANQRCEYFTTLSKISQKTKKSVTVQKNLKIVNNQISISLLSQQQIDSKASKQVLKNSLIQQINNLIQSDIEQSDKIKKQTKIGKEKVSENQYFSALQNKKRFCNEKHMKTENKGSSRNSRFLIRSNSNKLIPPGNSISNRQNIIKRDYIKSLQQKKQSPKFKSKNLSKRNQENQKSQREQLQAKNDISLSQSLDLSKTLNLSNVSKSKYKYNYYAEKSKINTCIFGAEYIEQNIKKLSYLKIDICKFHYIIEDGLSYIYRVIQKKIAFPNDKIRTYKSVHELYQFLRFEEDYDLGFIICLRRNAKLINLKLLPQHYFIVNLDNQKQSYVEISQEARKIKIGQLKYFELAQNILIEKKLQKYILYRKKNTNVIEIVNKFKNSEFIIESFQTKFSVNLLDPYFNDYNRLTRLYFICDEAQLTQIKQTILRYHQQNQFFLLQSCNIICAVQNKLKKQNHNIQYPLTVYVNRGDYIQDYSKLLSYFKKSSKQIKNNINLQIIFLPDSLNIDDLFNEEYPGRFELITYSNIQQAEQIAINKKIQDQEIKLYFLTLQMSNTNSLIFDKQFVLTKLKSSNSSKIAVSNLLEMLQLLRF